MIIQKPMLLSGVAMFLATFGLSNYASGLDKTEIVHFWVAAPAGVVYRPMVVRAAAADCPQHPGASTGAARPVRLTPIAIDLDKRGFLKRVFQPNVEALSTHWIHNVGAKPLRIRMDLVNLKTPVKWDVNANFPYDRETHTFTRALLPGQSIPNLGIDWIFRIPPGSRMVYEGGLQLTDADTGELLTFIPIRIGRGLPASPRRPA